LLRVQAVHHVDGVSAALVDFVDTGIRSVFDYLETPSRDVPSPFAIPFLQQCVDSSNAFVSGVHIRGNTAIRQVVDRIDTPFGHPFRRYGIRDVGGLSGRDLRTGQQGDGGER